MFIFLKKNKDNKTFKNIFLFKPISHDRYSLYIPQDKIVIEFTPMIPFTVQLIGDFKKQDINIV